MTTHVIYYRIKPSENTRDPLREISREDQEYLKRVMTAYLMLPSVDPREEFAAWFNMPNPQLPSQPRKNYERNSMRSMAEGVIEKLSASPNRRDLSPRTCDGIETMSQQIADCYDRDLCPTIQFRDATLKNMPRLPAGFDKVFRKTTT